MTFTTTDGSYGRRMRGVVLYAVPYDERSAIDGSGLALRIVFGVFASVLHTVESSKSCD